MYKLYVLGKNQRPMTTKGLKAEQSDGEAD